MNKKKKVERELRILNIIVKWFEKLDKGQRKRIYSYIYQRFIKPKDNG